MFLYTSCEHFFLNFVGITAHKEDPGTYCLVPFTQLTCFLLLSTIKIDFIDNTTTMGNYTKSYESIPINFQCQIIFGYRIDPYR